MIPRIFFAVVFLLLASPCPARSAELPKEPLKLHLSENRTYLFMVEVARKKEDRAKGLMERKFLAEESGMLFLFEEEAPVSLWMKNTPLPLDMLFINKKGIIVDIHENAEPGSLEIITSKNAVSAALELIGGSVEKWQIKTGDRISHPFFK